jgi:phytoene dehydrogenase-like protein
MAMQRVTSWRGQSADAVVVGGGLSGLVAATVLAKGGSKVILMEKSNHAGGRAVTQEFDGGYHLNLGAHALYRKGAAQRILRELGIKWTGAAPPSKGGQAIYRGRKHLFPTEPWSLFTTGLLSFKEKIEAMRLLASLSRVDAQSLNHVSLAEWLRSMTKSERVRQLLSTVVRVTTYTNDDEHLSAGAALTQVKLGLAGNVEYLDHGWQTLVDGALAAARAAGVEILTNASVINIKRDGDYLLSLRNGESYGASAVVLATAPAAALSMIENGEETVLRKWVDEARPVQVACLDVALKRLPQPFGSLFALGIDRPLYCIVHSAAARLAPAGGAVIHLMKYQEACTETDAKADRRELEELLDLMQPGWRALVAHTRFLPRITASNAVVTAAQGGTKGRPGPSVPGMPGLYVAGDWVGDEGMLLDAALSSAHHAAQLILKRQSEASVHERSHRQPHRLIA